jgi:hypothetical protein
MKWLVIAALFVGLCVLSLNTLSQEERWHRQKQEQFNPSPGLKQGRLDRLPKCHRTIAGAAWDNTPCISPFSGEVIH